MFPYHDDNRTQRTPVVTYVLITLNVLMWLLVQGAGSTYELAYSICDLGLIPGALTGSVKPGSGFLMAEDLACVTDPGPQVHTLFTSMFLHGSWMHLLGNVWFLWLFGNNIEDSMSRGRFVVFYLLCGLGAALLQVFTDPGSVIPMVGASGAISGVMGAYLLLFPRVKVYAIIPLGWYPLSVKLPAWSMLVYWFGLQVLGGFVGHLNGASGGVAFWAHVGGFATGLLLIRPFVRRIALEAHRQHHWQPKRVARW